MLVEPSVRQAKPTDEAAIRDVARRSLRASYSLSPNVIASAVEQWYPSDGAPDEGTGSDALVLVATGDDGIVGYSESTVRDDQGDIRWLHVDPDYRGRGIGSHLLERTREELRDRGVARLQGRVLADNREGNNFYEDHGFERVGTDEIEIDDRTYVENVYVDGAPRGLRVERTPDGERVYVDVDTTERGSRAPFRVVHTDPERGDRYGYFCSHCESLATAMDPMGRIQCGDCDNVRKPTRWDAAYM